MQIVTDIDEEQYKFIKQSMTMDKVKDYHALLYDICEHIKNGTPLPKGHGRIVDGDVILTWLIYKGLIDKLKCGEIATVFERATIIEADKEQENEP